jgi:ribosomal protein S1
LTFFYPITAALSENKKNKLVNEKNYLQNLLETVVRRKEDDLSVQLNVVNATKNGFTIKVCGLFGYLQFKYMPWHYRSIHHWRAVSSSIVGNYFIGKIESVETEPIKIITNATSHIFKTVELEHDFIYNGIIIEKKKFGLLVEIGNHFGWRFGSIVGFIHKSFLLDIEDFNQANVGQTITTQYQGKNRKEEYLFGDIYIEEVWINDYIETLIGTTQIATVKINETTNKREYFVQGNIRCGIAITKTLQDKWGRKQLREYLKTLGEGDEIECEVLTCNHIKKKIMVKIADKYF